MIQQEHRDPMVRATGRIVTDAMVEILTLPEEFRRNAEMLTSIKTVDGHAWTIKLEYNGFEGPDTLRRSTP